MNHLVLAQGDSGTDLADFLGETLTSLRNEWGWGGSGEQEERRKGELRFICNNQTKKKREHFFDIRNYYVIF